MRDKRPISELSVEELERILAIRKREQRQERLRHYDTQGRRVAAPVIEIPRQHEAAEHVAPLEPPVTYDMTDEPPRFEDDEDERPRKPKTAPPPQSPPNGGTHYRPTWDKTLLAIEVFAITGFIIVAMFGAYYLISENRRLNDKMDAVERESAEVQLGFAALIATPTPAPELSIRLADYVLPSGHTYDDGVAMFNFDELPESVRPAAFAQQLNAPQSALVQVEADSDPAQIVIEALDPPINVSIWEGDDWATLQKGVGHLTYTADPGQVGNMVLTGHNDIYGEVFRFIGNLEPGDEIRVMNRRGQWYTYVVTERRVVNPSQTEVLLPRGGATLTLITCHPYQRDTQRMIIFADLRD